MISRVKTNNFMCLNGEFKFEKGVTFVHGENGSGKTTLSNAILFALYGPTAIADVNKDDLLSYGETSGYVELEIGDDNQIIKIKRPIGRGKVEITSADRGTLTGAKEAEAFIREHFGSLDLFLISHIARQQEISSLIRFEPRIRKQIFSDIAGLSIIDKAIEINGTVTTITEVFESDINKKSAELKDLEERATHIDFNNVYKYKQLKEKLAYACDYNRESLKKELTELSTTGSTISDEIKQRRVMEEFYSDAIRTASKLQRGSKKCLLCNQEISNPETTIQTWNKKLSEIKKELQELLSQNSEISKKANDIKVTLGKTLRKDIEEELEKIGEQEDPNEVLCLQNRIGALRQEIKSLTAQLKTFQQASEKKEIRTVLQEFKQFMLRDMIKEIQRETQVAAPIITSDWTDPIYDVKIDPETIAITINGKPIRSRSCGQANIICAIIRFCISTYWHNIQGKLGLPFIIMDSPFDALSDTNFDKMIETIQLIEKTFGQIIITSHRTTDNPGNWNVINL